MMIPKLNFIRSLLGFPLAASGKTFIVGGIILIDSEKKDSFIIINIS